jgi:putative glutamine amidotransferase
MVAFQRVTRFQQKSEGLIMKNKPLIGLSLCRWLLKDRDEGWFHLVGEKYIKVITGYGAFPLAIPAIADDLDIDTVLDRVSGIIFSGSVSNIHPSLYGAKEHDDFNPKDNDKDRDATVLRLMPAAIERGIPIFGVCRGIQEMNVLYGGTLHPKVHELPGMLDHREINAPDEICYAPIHGVTFPEGGILHRATGVTEMKVNSLHGQGINKVGEGLQVEAVAEDGLVEAISVKGSKGYTLAVQWHPEYHFWQFPLFNAINQSFHDAVREYHEKHHG